ncbi:MAG: ABC transporter permease [Actinomycetota bacterium]
MRPVLLSLVLVAAAVLISRFQRLRMEAELMVATLRAAVQLAVVTLVVGAVFANAGYAGLFVLIMYGAACWTAWRRLIGVRWGGAIGSACVAAGSLPPLLVLFGLGGYPPEPRYLIPVAGILIGGSMKATTLTGTILSERLAGSVAEFEARLSLGVSANTALRAYLPDAIRNSLLPVLDQTKNVGLITLPGAFVGMVLGGSSPAEASMVQLTVLFSLLGAETMAACACALLVGRSFIGPGERIVLAQRTAAG